MKKIMAVLFVVLILCGFCACDYSEPFGGNDFSVPEGGYSLSKWGRNYTLKLENDNRFTLYVYELADMNSLELDSLGLTSDIDIKVELESIYHGIYKEDEYYNYVFDGTDGKERCIISGADKELFITAAKKMLKEEYDDDSSGYEKLLKRFNGDVITLKDTDINSDLNPFRSHKIVFDDGNMTFDFVS